jgi:hypothetical protein
MIPKVALNTRTNPMIPKVELNTRTNPMIPKVALNTRTNPMIPNHHTMKFVHLPSFSFKLSVGVFPNGKET